MKKPNVLQQEHINHLNELRKLGVNIYRMVPILQEKFDLQEKEAAAIVAYWIRSS